MSYVNRNNGYAISSFSSYSSKPFYFGYFDNWKNFFEENQRDREEIARTNPFFKRSFYDPFEKQTIQEAERKVF